MGSLQERLKQFKKQQEKCQSVLSEIAANATPRATSKQQFMRPIPIVPQGPAPPVKFSEDTERLQNIYNIRKSSVGLQIKRVIDLLSQTRKAFTPEEIDAATYVDMKANKAVFESLKTNHKVCYDGERFSYKATHDLKDKRQLLLLVRRYRDGIAVTELKDAYPSVLEDLQALKASGDIWLISSSDSKEDIAYPNDPRLPRLTVDDDLKELFREIVLPQDMLDLENDLSKHGMKPVTNTAQRRARDANLGLPTKPDPKKKKREISKRTKLTNTHLPDLFE